MEYDFGAGSALGEFKIAIERYLSIEENETLKLRASAVNNALIYIDINIAEYHHYSQITLARHYNSLIGEMKRFHSLDQENKQRSIKRMLFQVRDIIIEKVLSLREWSHTNEGIIIDENSSIYNGITEDERFSLKIREQLLNFDIMNKKIKENEQRYLKAVEEKELAILNASKTVEDWQTKIEDHEERLKAYSDNAKKIASEYNFVGITKAFIEIEHEKKKSLDNCKMWLIFFGFLMFVPFLLTAYNLHAYVLQNPSSVDTNLKMIAYFALPSIPFEIILIYFFRIILRSYNSLKAQIVQLEIRRSLCAFIEGYAEFAKREKDAKLDKFESMIFSGLTPDPDNVPSTFDGVEQIANFVKAIKDK